MKRRGTGALLTAHKITQVGRVVPGGALAIV